MEVRKKRTFIKRDDAPEVVAEAAARSAQAAQASQELVRREEEAASKQRRFSQEEVELVRERQEREEREDRARKEREAEERAAAYAAAEAAKARQAKEAAKEVAENNAAFAEAVAPRRKQKHALRPRKNRANVRQKRLHVPRIWMIAVAKALQEAEAIRAMMAAPKKVLVAKKPEEPKKAVAAPAADAKKAPAKDAKGAAPATAKEKESSTANRGGKDKEVKSSKLSSTWGNDAGKKKEIKTRGDSSGGVGRNRAGAVVHAVAVAGDRNDQHQNQQQQEFRALEISVPMKPSRWPNWHTRWR